MLNGPRKTKYKKTKKGKLKKLEFKANKLKFGNIGLKAKESGIINSRQIEAARQAIVRKIKRKGKLWIKIFPDVYLLHQNLQVFVWVKVKDNITLGCKSKWWYCTYLKFVE
jgi:large subunit ribosomal protein L16